MYSLGSLYKKGIFSFEAVQQRFTRLIPGMLGLSDGKRLNQSGIDYVEFGKVKADLIDM